VLSDDGEVRAIHVFPYLYPDHSGAQWSVAWMMAVEGSTGADVVDLAIDGTFSTDLGMLDIPGYTPRIAPTATPGIYWAAWARGEAPLQNVGYRFFEK
jgi:hypothetical protein